MSFEHAPAKAAVVSMDKLLPNPEARLREQFNGVIRSRHLSTRTKLALRCWAHPRTAPERNRIGARLCAKAPAAAH
jgi:hypothetical protein